MANSEPRSEPIFGGWPFANLVETPNLALSRCSGAGYQRLLAHIVGQSVYCPMSGPYLHYAFQGDVPHESFFQEVLTLLKARSYKTLSVRLPPNCYASWVEPLSGFFRDQPGAVEVQDLNYHLPLVKPFFETLPADQRRVLRLARQVGYECTFSEDWEAIRAIVSDSRIIKGYTDAVSLQLLQQLVKVFPFNYHGIICKTGEETAGAGILIRVDPNIAYLFYVANRPGHLRFSPSLQMIAFCAEWAKSQGFALLDLGTASKGALANEGVRRFKESLGGVLSLKSSFQIPL